MPPAGGRGSDQSADLAIALAALADLRQLSLHGTVRDGTFRAERRTGALDPVHPGTLDQLRSLRALGRAARKNRPALARWAPETNPGVRVARSR
jgi:hypothetical protein